MEHAVNPNYMNLLKDIEAIVAGPSRRDEKLLNISRTLKAKVPHFHWVGFYLTDPASPRELVLGPFDGAPTGHTRIAFGQGICGQAADRKETFIIQDVTKETNYLSCSPNVKSEIVVPVFKEGKVAGEIDIDSHAPAPFTPDDREFLERAAGIVARLF